MIFRLLCKIKSAFCVQKVTDREKSNVETDCHKFLSISTHNMQVSVYEEALFSLFLSVFEAIKEALCHIWLYHRLQSSHKTHTKNKCECSLCCFVLYSMSPYAHINDNRCT